MRNLDEEMINQIELEQEISGWGNSPYDSEEPIWEKMPTRKELEKECDI